ncbi:hypothetical protein VKT23_019155 [Stygiomarasmius scandens]|uniref:C2H2-type domain-containing protein n=1 Tax=Marasmiellus scandens TaxID=2682957 RepID=A0ABR1IPK2_9AGAR
MYLPTNPEQTIEGYEVAPSLMHFPADPMQTLEDDWITTYRNSDHNSSATMMMEGCYPSYQCSSLYNPPCLDISRAFNMPLHPPDGHLDMQSPVSVTPSDAFGNSQLFLEILCPTAGKSNNKSGSELFSSYSPDFSVSNSSQDIPSPLATGFYSSGSETVPDWNHTKSPINCGLYHDAPYTTFPSLGNNTNPAAVAKDHVGTYTLREAARRRRRDPSKKGAYVCPMCGQDFTASHNLRSKSS